MNIPERTATNAGRNEIPTTEVMIVNTSAIIPSKINQFFLFLLIEIETASLGSFPSLTFSFISEWNKVLETNDMINIVNIPKKNAEPNGNQNSGNRANIANNSTIVIPAIETNPVHPENINTNNAANANPINNP
jgi:hypothetical protein